MSEVIEDQVPEEQDSSHSAEEKFFGIKTTHGKKKQAETGSESSEYEFEIVDDRPQEDRRPAKASQSSSDDDEELGQYSDKVQKRLNKLKFDYHEERRQRESAERMREEAVKVAQQYANKAQEQESLISRGEAALVEQIRERAHLRLEQAKEGYRKAYEEGDTDGVVNTQEQMLKAQSELSEIERYRNNLNNQAQNAQAYQQQAYQQDIARRAAQNVAAQQQVQPQVTPEAEQWAQKNNWFMAEGYEDMTALAYGAHTQAVRSGIDVRSKEYFDYIDGKVRSAFPDYDWSDSSDTNGRSATVTTNRPSTVVAPSARNNGAKPRKVRLTATQVALAKRLGLTNEQYARHAEML
jgi:hypothetical protein